MIINSGYPPKFMDKLFIRTDNTNGVAYHSPGLRSTPVGEIREKFKPWKGFTKGNNMMAQSLVQIYLHIIFSTKNRKPFLKTDQTETYSYLAGISKNLECPALIIDGTEDHVHLLPRHSKNISVVDYIRELKRSSSKWIKTLNPKQDSFGWQNGCGVFSISTTHVDHVKEYIANQK